MGLRLIHWEDNALCGGSTAIPELLWPLGLCAGSPLPDGRVDLRTVASGYSYSGIAIADFLRLMVRAHLLLTPVA